MVKKPLAQQYGRGFQALQRPPFSSAIRSGSGQGHQAGDSSLSPSFSPSLLCACPGDLVGCLLNELPRGLCVWQLTRGGLRTAAPGRQHVAEVGRHFPPSTQGRWSWVVLSRALWFARPCCGVCPPSLRPRGGEGDQRGW